MLNEVIARILNLYTTFAHPNLPPLEAYIQRTDVVVIPSCPTPEQAKSRLPENYRESLVAESSYYLIFQKRYGNLFQGVARTFVFLAYDSKSRTDKKPSKMEFEDFIEFLRLNKFNVIEVYGRNIGKKLDANPLAIIYKDDKNNITYYMTDAEPSIPDGVIDHVLCNRQFEFYLIHLLLGSILERRIPRVEPQLPNAPLPPQPQLPKPEGIGI